MCLSSLPLKMRVVLKSFKVIFCVLFLTIILDGWFRFSGFMSIIIFDNNIQSRAASITDCNCHGGGAGEASEPREELVQEVRELEKAALDLDKIKAAILNPPSGANVAEGSDSNFQQIEQEQKQEELEPTKFPPLSPERPIQILLLSCPR